MLLHVGEIMYLDEVKVPKAPDDWVDPDTNTENRKPTSHKVDNPGIWSSFSYRPVFVSGSQGGQYKAHCLPAGFQVVSTYGDNAAICTHVG